jgi:hypothetical protein
VEDQIRKGSADVMPSERPGSGSTCVPKRVPPGPRESSSRPHRIPTKSSLGADQKSVVEVPAAVRSRADEIEEDMRAVWAEYGTPRFGIELPREGDLWDRP